MQQGVEAVASASGKAQAENGRQQAPPVSLLHALASAFWRHIPGPLSTADVCGTTQQGKQHHLTAVGPQYTGKR